MSFAWSYGQPGIQGMPIMITSTTIKYKNQTLY
jgi:hypothetical protein